MKGPVTSSAAAAYAFQTVQWTFVTEGTETKTVLKSLHGACSIPLFHNSHPNTNPQQLISTLQLARTRSPLHHAHAAVNSSGKQEERKGKEYIFRLRTNNPTRSIRKLACARNKNFFTTHRNMCPSKYVSVVLGLIVCSAMAPAALSFVTPGTISLSAQKHLTSSSKVCVPSLFNVNRRKYSGWGAALTTHQHLRRNKEADARQ